MDTLEKLIAERLSRRHLLAGLGASAGIAALLGPLAACKPETAQTEAGPAAAAPGKLAFADLPQVIADGDKVADGYQVRRLISWGDPIFPDAPAFDPSAPRAELQARQFGFNNDFMAYFPLPAGSDSSDHGLLAVNHEYTDPELMFAGYKPREQTPEQSAYEMAAHGLSIIEVRREAGAWRVVTDSPYNRRVTATTRLAISGPAAGAARMRTSYDPQGRAVRGTLGNCGGGTTPWGTMLSGEENIHVFFGSAAPAPLPQAASYSVMGIVKKPGQSKRWFAHDKRFDLAEEPNEPNCFGWVVEFDPHAPDAAPVKRTALGRFKHEAATTVQAPDGRLVVYMGDDEPFQFLYRFVTRDKVDPANRSANKDLLDFGTLSAARFDAEGVTWLPLLHGQGPLTAENGFASEAEMLIETRRAAAALGATPMDRPEDVETNPHSGRVYAVLTNNRQRAVELTPGNPRAKNPHGHILELTPPPNAEGKPDHAAERYAWDAFLFAGDAASDAQYGPGTKVWLSSPDNITFDPGGNLWIASDQGSEQAGNGIPDGMFACATDGEARATLKFFYAVPRGAECCGPVFTPDGTTLFVAVQHPGEGSSFDAPSTRWPDFKEGVPPRPSVVFITRNDGGVIGG